MLNIILIPIPIYQSASLLGIFSYHKNVNTDDSNLLLEHILFTSNDYNYVTEWLIKLLQICYISTDITSTSTSTNIDVDTISVNLMIC